MTRKKTKHFLCSFGLNNMKNVERYNSGWSLSELKAWKEFLEDWYNKEKKCFRQTIIMKK